MSEASRLAAWVQQIPDKLRAEPCRRYAAPWDDWPNGNTGASIYPVVYALWEEKEDASPQYVGQSTGLGRRLWQHFADTECWQPVPKYVSYLESKDFRNPELLLLAEAFVIAVFKPPQNAETWREPDRGDV